MTDEVDSKLSPAKQDQEPKIRWYRRDPDAALGDMVGLTLEERGAYITIIDLLYSTGGEIPDDDRFVCRHLGCRPQVWKRLKSRLISLGKLTQNSGKTTSKLVENELNSAKIRIVSAKFAAIKRWENKDQANATAHMLSTNTNTNRVSKKESKKEEDTPSGSANGHLVEEGNYAFESGVIRLKAADLDRWQKSFTEINVKAELESSAEWICGQAASGKNWFFAAAGLLGKRNRDAKARREIAAAPKPSVPGHGPWSNH